MKDENKRNLYLKVRVSQEEMDAIKRKFENSGMDTLSGFVRAMIFDGYIVQFDNNELRKIHKLASNIANNWTIVNKVDRKIKKAIQIGQEPKGY